MHVMAEQLARFSPEAKRRYQACLRKIGYPSAKEAAAVRERRQAQVDEVLRVYACDDCGLFHLTHQPLSDAQVLELEDLFITEITRLGEAWQRLRQMAKPYTKPGSVLRRKTPQDVDADFARAVDLQEQVFVHWLCVHQRQFALRLAHATTAEEARAIDVRARKVLDESLRMHARDREGCLRAHQLHREAAAAAMNQVFTLPSFGWRSHLAR